MLSLNQRIDLKLLGMGIVVESDEDSKASTKNINKADIDRRAMLQAMTNSGHSVTSLANAADVEPSMVSRLLRKPTSGDPNESARNPSISTAAKVSSALNASTEALFPDIFDSKKSSQRGKKGNKSKKKLQSRDGQ
jgi:transcriptional regulator with XRE-family HTH domain